MKKFRIVICGNEQALLTKLTTNNCTCAVTLDLTDNLPTSQSAKQEFEDRRGTGIKYEDIANIR